MECYCRIERGSIWFQLRKLFCDTISTKVFEPLIWMIFYWGRSLGLLELCFIQKVRILRAQTETKPLCLSTNMRSNIRFRGSKHLIFFFFFFISKLHRKRTDLSFKVKKIVKFVWNTEPLYRTILNDSKNIQPSSNSSF